jgi:hypothetical protein
MYSLYYFLFVWAWQAVYVIARHHRRDVLLPWAVASSIAAILYHPWAWVPLFKAQQLGGMPAMAEGYVFRGLALPRALAEFGLGFGWAGLAPLILVVLAVWAAVAVAAGAVRLARGGEAQRDALWLFGLAFAGPFACLAVLPVTPHVFESKHLVVAAPFLFLLAAAAVRAGTPRHGDAVWAIPLVLLAVMNVSSLAFYYAPDFEKENWRGLAADVRRSVRAGDVICLDPFYLTYPFRYYFGYVPGVRLAPLRHDALPRELAVAAKDAWRLWIVQDFSKVSRPGLHERSPQGEAGRRLLRDRFALVPAAGVDYARGACGRIYAVLYRPKGER